MAVIIDLSQICLSGTFSFSEELKVGSADKERGKSILRHIILSQLKSYKKKYSPDYGDLVISCDGHHYWRKKLFPEYKSQRKKQRDASGFDWKLIFDCISEMVKDLKEVFPYKVISVDSAESDDVIAVLTKKFVDEGQKVMIISSDKDFVQLHKYKDVYQVSPQSKKFVFVENPIDYLKEKIIRGDRGDGIPNILSPNNSFTDNIKQTSMTKKKLLEFMEHSPKESSDEVLKERYIRNEKLIDFDYIPEDIKTKILNEYEKPILGSKGKVFNYLIKNGCNLLLGDVDNF